MSRQNFLDAIQRRGASGRMVFGTGTSIVCQDLMREVGTAFPEGHTNPEAMFQLALAGHTLLGFDVVMPLFSVCRVNWGGPNSMPESGPPIFATSADIAIPPDLLTRPGCAVPLKALAMLRRELGDAAA